MATGWGIWDEEQGSALKKVKTEIESLCGVGGGSKDPISFPQSVPITSKKAAPPGPLSV